MIAIYHKRQSGQLLLEAILAIAVLSVAGLGAGFLITSLVGSKSSVEKDTATNLLEETLDAVRAISFEKWANLASATKGANYCVYPSDSATACANPSTNIGYTLYDKEIGGSSWKTGNWDAANMKSASASSLRNAWVVGESGNAWRYDGEAWKDFTAAGVSFNDVSMTSFSEGWLVGDNCAIYKYSGGSTISSQSCPGATSNLNSVSSPKFDHHWIVGSGGKVLQGSGDTWTNNPPAGLTADMFGVSGKINEDEFDKEAAIAGASGNVWYFNGSSWSNISPSGVSTIFRSVSMIDENNIWVAGDEGKVYRYDGADWDDNQTPALGSRWCDPSCVTIRRITAYANNVVFIAGDDGHFWRYDGSTWSRISGTGKWESSAIFGLSDRLSPDVWLVGASGNVWRYAPPKFVMGSADTTGQVTVNNTVFTRSFSIQNVCRDTTSEQITVVTDTSGTTENCNGSPSGDTFDPSALKITATVSWAGGSVSSFDYVTRWQNAACYQTEWATAVVFDYGASGCPSDYYISQTNLDHDGALSITALQSTGTLRSRTFDVVQMNNDAPRGAIFNSLMWRGSAGNASSRVSFQVAAANCANGNIYIAGSDEDCGTSTTVYWGESGGEPFIGSDCTASTFYIPTINVPTDLGCYSQLNNKRYFKYTVTLCRVYSGGACTSDSVTTSPTINDISINWSP